MKKNSRGFMYLAKRPCGKVTASAWDDEGYEKETAKSIAKWIKRGDVIERIEVFDGDPMPEWICYGGCKQCKSE